MTTGAARGPNGRIDFAARFVVRAAMTAPSIDNTRPWSFASSRDVISIYADPDGAVPADPPGREMVISGGAALFNLRLAMRHLGFASDVRLLPRPDRFDHLADVRWGRYARPTGYQERLYRAMTRRRTHAGRFTVSPVQTPLITELGGLARDERVALHVVSGTGQIRVLAQLVRMAELTRRAELDFAAERARRPEPRRGRLDDHLDDHDRLDERRNGRRYRRRFDGISALYGGRMADRAGFADRAGGTAGHDDTGHDPRWPLPVTAPARPSDDHALGVVAVLATPDDGPLDWLLAGRVLQRLLLHATVHQVSAAFHIQPLKLDDYRRRIQTEFTGGAYPQVLLRLGHAAPDAKACAAGSSTPCARKAGAG